MRQFMRILGLISRQEERRKQRRRWLMVIGLILLLWMVVGLWVAVALFQFFGSKDLVTIDSRMWQDLQLWPSAVTIKA